MISPKPDAAQNEYSKGVERRTDDTAEFPLTADAGEAEVWRESRLSCFAGLPYLMRPQLSRGRRTLTANHGPRKVIRSCDSGSVFARSEDARDCFPESINGRSGRLVFHNCGKKTEEIVVVDGRGELVGASLERAVEG